MFSPFFSLPLNLPNPTCPFKRVGEFRSFPQDIFIVWVDPDELGDPTKPQDSKRLWVVIETRGKKTTWMSREGS